MMAQSPLLLLLQDHGASNPSLAVAPLHGRALFDAALHALSLCSDVADACASRTARVYVAGSSGALRHALVALANEGRMRQVTGDRAFETARLGRSEAIGEGGTWDTVRDCVMPDGGLGTVHAYWPVTDIAAGIWARRDNGMPGLTVRGRLRTTTGGVEFVDDRVIDLPPAPATRCDLGRDLVRAGLPDLHHTPALAAALEMALVSGSWVHLGTGRRWFADATCARAIVRMLGGTVTMSDAATARLSGAIDHEALLLIERLGWRHLPTPGVD